MYASLNISGTDPFKSDRLNSLIRNGTTTSATALSWVVGIAGQAHNACQAMHELQPPLPRSSPAETVARIRQIAYSGALIVSDRTPATLSSKWRWNWLALMSLTGGTRPRPSSASIERLSWLGVDFSASIFSLQNCSRLRRVECTVLASLRIPDGGILWRAIGASQPFRVSLDDTLAQTRYHMSQATHQGPVSQLLYGFIDAVGTFPTEGLSNSFTN